MPLKQKRKGIRKGKELSASGEQRKKTSHAREFTALIGETRLRSKAGCGRREKALAYRDRYQKKRFQNAGTNKQAPYRSAAEKTVKKRRPLKKTGGQTQKKGEGAHFDIEREGRSERRNARSRE